MLWWLVQNALTTCVLAGLVDILCRVGRFRPCVCHVLWLVVLVKLLTPPLVQWPWPLPSLGLQQQPVLEAAEEYADMEVLQFVEAIEVETQVLFAQPFSLEER